MFFHDCRMQLPDDNVFRRLTNTIAQVPADAKGWLQMRTAHEIEQERLCAKRKT